MYAIITTGGKQYKVSEGDVIKIEKLETNEGDTITFDKVNAVCGSSLEVGTPYLNGHTVSAVVTKNGRSKKVIVYRYKRKSGYHKKNGHRQPYTEVKIQKIS